jgi:hypothetical protein
LTKGIKQSEYLKRIKANRSEYFEANIRLVLKRVF